MPRGWAGGGKRRNDKIHFGTQGQLDLGDLMARKIHDNLQLP